MIFSLIGLRGIDLICMTSSLENSSCSVSSFQQGPLSSISYATNASLLSLATGDWILLVRGLTIHLSFQILIILQFPNLQIKPAFRTSQPTNKLFHTIEGQLPSFVFKKLPLGKHLCVNTWLTRELGSFRSLQHCLDSIARLKLCISLKPSSPLILAAPSFSHCS